MHFYDHIYSTIFFWIKWLRSNTETLTKILLIQPGQLLSTSCGSPCYIAPEVRQLSQKTFFIQAQTGALHGPSGAVPCKFVESSEHLIGDSAQELRWRGSGRLVLWRDPLWTACWLSAVSGPQPDKLVQKGKHLEIFSATTLLIGCYGNIAILFKKISRAQFTFPGWFTPLQKKLILRILEPSPIRVLKFSINAYEY